MERKEYDMIEGYLDGTLDEASARELEAMATDDPELAAELEAERIIRTTLARDVASIPPIATEPSGLLVARLAATSGASGGAAGTSGGVLGTIFGTGTGLGVVTVVGLIGLTIGAIFFAENVEVIDPLPSPAEQEHVRSTAHPQVGTVDVSEDSRTGRNTVNTTSGEEADRANGIASSLAQPEQLSRFTPRSSAASTTATSQAVKRTPRTDVGSSLLTDDPTPQSTEPSSDNPTAVGLEQEAQDMLDRLRAEEHSRTDPIPQIEGPSSTMEVRIEN